DEVPAYLNRLVDPMDNDGFVHLSDLPGLGEDIDFNYIETNTLKSF
ncbi:enolase, partial [Klebsiella pneumoniae]|nr:enolase [Klebsiella pneumoniae]